MTFYLVACAATAPALLIGLLVAAGWIVAQGLQIRHLIKPGRTCTQLGQCASQLTDDHADRTVS